MYPVGKTQDMGQGAPLQASPVTGLCRVAGRTHDCHGCRAWDTSGTKTPISDWALGLRVDLWGEGGATPLDSSLVPARCLPLSPGAASYHRGI